MLSTHFKPLGYKIPTKEAAYCLVKMFACCSKEAAKIATYWGVARTFDNTRSKQELGIEYIPMSDSLRDMGLNMIETGVVPDKRPADAKCPSKSRLPAASRASRSQSLRHGFPVHMHAKGMAS